MTWRWLICFSLAGGAAAGAEISGQITLQDSQQASVRKAQDYSGVVISLEALSRSESAGEAPKRSRMVQKGKTFTPHILPIQAGATVDFPNFDPFFHNAFSRYNGQMFDIGLYAPGTSRAILFKRPGVVRVFCNIHPTMSAVIVVLDTPYFSVTGKDGRFVLNVPAGRYELHVFHERATEPTLARLTREVTVASEALQLPAMVISEAGYLTTPHTNKYDRQYPPEADDRAIYPGVRK